MDIIKQALDEVEKEHGYNTSILDKAAFNINIDPSSIVGAVTGAVIAKNQVKKNMMQKYMENDIQPAIGGSYYRQVENLSNNLKIIFTPFSVIIAVKNGAQQVTIDTIETEEMDSNMYRAYQNKNAEYFKTLVLNKIKAEVHFAEQMFSKRLVQKQLELQSQLNKKASEDLDLTEISFSDMLDNVRGIKAVFEKNANSPLGQFFLNVSKDEPVYICDIGLDSIRPLDKYASIFTDTLNFFGFNVNKDNIKELQKKMLVPGYLEGRLKISFLPDRVIFVVDNMVVTQLAIMDMNEDGFEAFQKSDQRYFKDLFKIQMTKNLNENFEPIKKKANTEIDIKDIFSISEIHPQIYFLELTKKFNDRWIEFDPEVLVKEIEIKYSLEDGLADIPLNKILTMQLINKSERPFINSMVFEKCIRTFNSKPIDFMQSETNLSLGEIIFGLKMMQDLTPKDDIYDNFSEEVSRYIAEVLSENNYRAAYPKFILNSGYEVDFYRDLNDQMIELWDRITTENLFDNAKISKLKKENREIVSMALKIIGILRDNEEYNPEVIDKIVNKISQDVKLEPYVENILVNNLQDNMAVDVYLQYKEDELNKQREIYNI